MYNVNVNGNTAASAPSYEKAVAGAKEVATNVANAIINSANTILTNSRLYRSPKTRQRVAAESFRRAANLVAAAKFPKKSGTVAVRAGGVELSIVKAD